VFVAQVRDKQLAYSELQARMLDEEQRRKKARKIISILRYHLGVDDLSGLTVVDLGCSVGWFVEEAAVAGATPVGVDIDAPGLAIARRERDPRCSFVSTDGSALPFEDESIDVIVFNHIYEHVVDPDAVMSEIRRVLKPGGIAYLGLGNRLGVIEPHYRLPFLSWLPQSLADRYIRASGQADTYYEQFRTLHGLRRLAGGLYVYDYSFTLVANPGAFEADDVVGNVSGAVGRRLGRRGRAWVRWLLPTYIWIAAKSPRGAAGTSLTPAPEPLETQLVMAPQVGADRAATSV
jgi:ubiquinone/menaquinone biosynthesis C-methylase UbiE